jgi:ParB/RepB/Spo0J family partition protein
MGARLAMRLRDHEGIKGKRDAYPFDPRHLKVDANYNVRDLTTPEAREKLDELKSSIRTNGVRIPLEIRLVGTDVFIVSGHRRHTAVMELIAEGEPIKSVLVLAEPDGMGEAERALNLAISNSGEPLTPLEMAEVVRRLCAFGWDHANIAKRIGWKSSATVKQHLDMLAMPEAVKTHVRNGEISATTARHLAKSELSPEQQGALIKANLEENKRIAPKGRSTKVTAKTIKRDKEKGKPKIPESVKECAHDQQIAPPAETAAEPVPVSDTARPLEAIVEPGVPERIARAAHEVAFLTRADLLIERVRSAVEYHQLGYGNGIDCAFEANEMLARMDRLAEALVVFDGATTEVVPDFSVEQQPQESH